MDISICILNRNQRALLKDCLTSCFAELDRGHLRGEIIVVDNASDDGSPEMISELFPDVRLIRNQENVGFSAGNNQAIRLSSGRYVLALNNDTVLLPECLGILVAYMDAHPDVGVAGPKLLNRDGSVQQGYHRPLPTLAEPLIVLFWIERLWPGNRLVGRAVKRARSIDDNVSDPTPIEQLGGCAMLLRRRALDAVGLFDENFSYTFEDVDLCHRLLKGGWSVYYVPRAQIIHYGGATFADMRLSKRVTMYFLGQLWYFRKHKGLLQFGILKVMTIVALVFRLIIASALELVPNARIRSRFSGMPSAYWRLLHSVISNRVAQQSRGSI
jgi:GT2 family glycosyltransferase